MSNEPNEPLEAIYDTSPGALVFGTVSHIAALKQSLWEPQQGPA